jgi:hypothetical protein
MRQSLLPLKERGSRRYKNPGDTMGEPSESRTAVSGRFISINNLWRSHLIVSLSFNRLAQLKRFLYSALSLYFANNGLSHCLVSSSAFV